jgi:phytoene dehydrogenase-like protein
MTAEPTRRGVIAGGSALTATALLPGCGTSAPFPGTLGGPDMTLGHRLRDGGFGEPTGAEERAAIVIAGGGIAGLAAGWTLAEAGFDDFVLYELENETGGNARGGRNDVSAYPLGAHYLPVPNREARALRQMLERFGIVAGADEAGAPRYDPLQLCADLEERLLWRGRWQEGLYPTGGLSAEDMRQRDRFFARMAEFRAAEDSDGKPAFAVPMAYSSGDLRFTALDRRNFADWLTTNGFTSAPLRAHLRYCCRDDYGTEPEHVSAWAGIHYFAARRGWAAGGDGDRELTWPEGNGRLATLMRQRISKHIRTGSPVFRARQDDEGAVVDRFDTASGRAIRTRAQCAILAMPHFVARRVAQSAVAPGTGFSYAPWIVANVTVSRLPRGNGTPLAWDNVSTASDSLGYVVATHQSSSAGDGPSVLSWYMPLSREKPADARKLLLTRSLANWQAVVRDDLLAMNPDLDGAIRRIDVWRWGHAMIRPAPGFLSDPDRATSHDLRPPLLLAHSDMSGLSLFEEAHYRGVAAAEAAMRALGHRFESMI